MTDVATPQSVGSAKERFEAARVRYRAVRDDIDQLAAAPLPEVERLARLRDLRDELASAEDDYVAASTELEKARAAERRAKTAEARDQLAELQPRLHDAVDEVERRVDDLLQGLGGLLDLNAERHAAQAELNGGGGNRVSLHRIAVGSWLAWKLSALRLGESPVWVHKTYRRPLDQLLGLTPSAPASPESREVTK